MAKLPYFFYVLKNKNKKDTASIAASKYFGIYYGDKLIVRVKKYPKDVISTSDKIQFIEEIFSYLLLLEREGIEAKKIAIKKLKKEKSEKAYAKYVKDVFESEANWKKLSLKTKTKIIAEEELKRKIFMEGKGLEYKKGKPKDRFSYYQVPVKTKSKVYDKYFRFKVIKSKKLRSFVEELEFYVFPSKSIKISERSYLSAAKIIKQLVLPHLIKTYKNIRTRKKSGVHMIIRFLRDYDSSKNSKSVEGWGENRYMIHSEKDLTLRLDKAIKRSILSDDESEGSWLRYLMIDDKENVYFKGFNIQFVYPTKLTDTEEINIKDYKNDFIKTVSGNVKKEKRSKVGRLRHRRP